MTDPRQPVYEVTDDEAKAIMPIVCDLLVDVLDKGYERIGCSSSSMTVLVLQVLVMEMSKVDSQATVAILRASADILNPALSKTKQLRAVQQHQKAARKFHASWDLMSEPTHGHA